MKKFAAVLSVIIIIYLLFAWHSRPLRHQPGILVAQDPQQWALAPNDPAFSPSYFPVKVPGYRLTPLARYDIKALVLSTHTYWFGTESKFSPVDFAVGWGAMSDQSIIDQLNISQGGRWYEFSYSQDPSIPDGAIISHSANMHLIPASVIIKNRLSRVRAGEVVELKGCLVQITGETGYQWVSSLTRTDTGGGACELMFVEDVSLQ